MPTYYDNWRDAQYACRACDWIGFGAQLVQGETFADLYEADCPSCGGRITTITFPTLAESRANWDKVAPGDKLIVELAEARSKEFEARKLRGPNQLPDLSGDDLILVWDIESRDGGDTIIRFGDIAVWREPAIYEGYERFVEIGDILVQRYGARLRDLLPTHQSELFLYGDRIGSPGRIEAFRKQLGVPKAV